MGVKVFGGREGVPFGVNAAGGIQDMVFAMVDGATNTDRMVKPATTGATVFDGVIGVTQTGIWHGHYGTSADPYPQNADVNIVSSGQVRVKLHDPDNAEGMEDGNLVAISDGGDGTIVKYAAPTVTPTMTATLSADPTKTEVEAYIAEYVSEYVAAYVTGVYGAVGRCVGDPIGGVACIELIGLGGIQHG